MSTFVRKAKRHTLSAVPTVCLGSNQAHVKAVQALRQHWRYDASQVKAPGIKHPLLFGRCQLFLDLTVAFDAMPREHLQEAFSLLGLPPHLSSLLLRRLPMWFNGRV